MSQHYSKAPVVEAIIDIKVAAAAGLSTLDLADALAPINSTYPHRESFSPTPAFQFASEGFSASFGMGSLAEGLRYQSADHLKALQVRNDGFTMSIFQPYNCWEEFRDEAMTLWEAFLVARKPDVITRVAIRYINRLLVPDEEPVEKFLRLFPPFDSSLGHLSAFQYRTQLTQTDLKATLLLTQASLVPTAEEKNTAPILLDIDLFRDKIPWQVGDQKALWEFVERLRERKNLVFESCLTDQMKELIR